MTDQNKKPEPMVPLELLFRALTAAPQRLTVGLLVKSLLQVRRGNDKRGPDARIAITDQMSKELKEGSDETKRPVYMLVGIPRDVAVDLEAARVEEKARSESLVITPAEFSAGVR